MRIFVLVMAVVFSASMSIAQDIGIQFSKMPVGTKMYYRDYEGDTWMQEYRGKSGKYYIIKETHSDRNLSVTRKYNAQGHMTQVSFVSGYIIRYSPHRCDRVMGACSYRYKGSRKRNGLYKSTLVRQGNGYVYSWARQKTDETYDSKIVLGPYNVLKEETWTSGSGKTRYVRLVKIETP